MLSQAHLMTVTPQFAGTKASSKGSGLEFCLDYTKPHVPLGGAHLLCLSLIPKMG